MILKKSKNKKGQLKALFIVLLLSIGLVSTYTISNLGVIAATRPMVRNIENKFVLYKTARLKEVQTGNFIFKYETGIDEEILNMVIQTAEDKYKEITEIFQAKLDKQVLVVIYDDMDLMMDTTMLSKGDPPMGVYYGDSIHIANPRLWSHKEEDLEDIFYRQGPILHELAHLFIDHIGRGNYPMWFTEGVSLYFEYLIDGYEWGAEVVFDEKDYTIEELNRNFNSLNQYEAYTKSFRLVKAFVENQGLDRLIHMIDSLGKGHNFNEFINLFEEI